MGTTLTNLGREHGARIERERGSGRRVVVIEADATPAAVAVALEGAGPDGVVFICGSEQERFDDAKAGLTELGHMGACAGAPGAQLWWGSRAGWRGTTPGAGELPVIISYYTIDTAYEEEAAGLIESCRALGLEHAVEGVRARGSWEGNCAMKAGFVQDAWSRLGRPVLWVDADARVRRSPELLRGVTADLAVHKAARWQFASGTVYFGASALAGEAVRVWRRRCEEDPMTWDQVHLDRAWEEVSLGAPLETLWLPQAYTRIFDQPEQGDGGGGAVVEHFQASRRLKGAVSGGVVRPFRDFDEATKAARRASRPRLND